MRDEEAVELPVDGVLDLHTFRPSEVKDLLPHYLDLCREKNILQVRIVHGKGKGILRVRVHAILKAYPHLSSYRLAGGEAGGWGATLVTLVPRTPLSGVSDTG